MPTSGWPWNGVVDAAAKQMGGISMADPASPSNTYLAFLSKVDFDVTRSTWFLFFDMIPGEAALLGLTGRAGRGTPPPVLPSIFFHGIDALEGIVLRSLGLKSTDDLAEGSWYVLLLAKGGDPTQAIVGDLYHPDLGFADGAPDYGTWQIALASLLALPVANGPKTGLGPPPTTRPETMVRTSGTNGDTAVFNNVDVNMDPPTLSRKRPPGMRKSLSPVRKRPRLPPSPPPPPPPPAPVPPPISGVGIMDIGQGGFNLLLDTHREPIAYFDVGYPLNFFRASLPNTMRIGNPAYTGPIYQNAAGNLEVILSHWDYDHWRFGRHIEPHGHTLSALNWTFPDQPLGGFDYAFATMLTLAGRGNALAPGFGVQAGPGGSVIYECVCAPGPGITPAFIRNNSGLALRFDTWLPVASQQLRGVLLTADANFDRLPAIARAGLAGITAVHHGSVNNGAAANIPVPPGGAAAAFIAYSYGVNAATGVHAYGFPGAGAVANYHAANWTAPHRQTTAEGANINAPLPLAHGNVRMGDPGALPHGYNYSAFFITTHFLG